MLRASPHPNVTVDCPDCAGAKFLVTRTTCTKCGATAEYETGSPPDCTRCYSCATVSFGCRSKGLICKCGSCNGAEGVQRRGVDRPRLLLRLRRHVRRWSRFCRSPSCWSRTSDSGTRRRRSGEREVHAWPRYGILSVGSTPQSQHAHCGSIFFTAPRRFLGGRTLGHDEID